MMVKVLANGDVVPDDDPRAASQANDAGNSRTPGSGGRPLSSVSPSGRPTSQGATRRTGPNIRGIDHSADDNVQGEGAQGGGNDQLQQIISGLNEKLHRAGIPRFNIGNEVVEPSTLVLFVLTLLLLGIRGMLLFLLVWVVIKLSNGHSMRSLFDHLNAQPPAQGDRSSENRAGPSQVPTGSADERNPGRSYTSGGGQRLGRE